MNQIPDDPKRYPRLPLHHTLAFRQVRQTVILALLLGLIFSFMQIYVDYVNQRDTMAKTLVHQAEVMTRPASDALWYLNGDLATGVIDGVFGNPSVVEGRILTASGYPLAVRWRNIPQQPYARLIEWLFGREQRIEKMLYYDPNNLEQRLVGKLIVVADPSVVGMEFLSRAATTLISGLVKHLLLALGLFLLFYFTCTRALVSLATFLQQVDPTQPDPQTLEVAASHRKDEIGLVARTFNAMIASLATHRQERDVLEAALISNNENLEQTVAERTAELEQTVLKLKQQSSYVRLLGQVAAIANVEPDPAIALGEALNRMLRLYNSPVGAIALHADWCRGKHNHDFWLQLRSGERVEQAIALAAPAYRDILAQLRAESEAVDTASVQPMPPLRLSDELLQKSRTPGRAPLPSTVNMLLSVPVRLQGDRVACIQLLLQKEDLAGEDIDAVLEQIGDHLSRVFERQQTNLKLLDLALTDPLTGVLNRRALQERFNDEFRLAVRHERQLACLVFDIDNFKVINDTYGHAGGDHVLIQLTAIVAELLRESDIFGRLGGEEFALVLPECGLSAALVVAERLRRQVNLRQILFSDMPIAVSVSIGVAMVEAVDDSGADALARADEALYQAKYAGKNCSWYYPPGAERPVPVTPAVLEAKD